MLYVVEVTWGKKLDLAIEQWEDGKKGRNRSALFEAIGELTDVSRNSVAKYVKATEPPRRRNERKRVVLLLRALGEKASDYGLTEDVVPPWITEQVLADTLATHNATCNSVIRAA